MRTSMLLLIALTLTMSAAAVTRMDVDGIDNVIMLGGNSKVTVPDIDEDLTAMPLTTSLSKFMADDKADGLPLNQSKVGLKVGSAVGYDRTAWYQNQLFFTPEEFAQLMETSTWLEFI